LWKDVFIFCYLDVPHTKSVVAKLEINGIERKYTHVIAAKGIELEGLPLASPKQRMDLEARLETIFLRLTSMPPLASGQAPIIKEIFNHE